MGRKSTVAVLDESIVSTVNQLIREGCTIDEILRALKPLGAEPSRSAMGRYVKSAKESMEKYRQAQEVAKVWVDKLEADPNGDVGRLLPEMLRAVAFQTLSQIGESEDGAGPEEIMFLAKALKDISGASKLNIDIALLRRKIAADAKAAAAEVSKVVKKAGLTDETVDAIRRKILGIGAQP